MRKAAAILLVFLPLAAAVPESVLIDVRSNIALVTATVNGSKPLTFIIDSAAACVCLDRNVAASLGLEPLGRATNSGSGGVVGADVLTGVPIRIGSREFAPDQIRGLDFSDFADSFDVPVHGILGKPFFMKYAVEIDYPNAVMRLLDPGTYASGKALTMRVSPTPTVRGTIQMPGGAPITARLEVDTGSGGVLILAAPFLRRHRLLEAVRGLETEQGRGVGGKTDFLVGAVAAVELGGFRLENPKTRFAQGNEGIFAQDYRDGNLGGGFLRLFKVVFDFPNSRLVLEQVK